MLYQNVFVLVPEVGIIGIDSDGRLVQLKEGGDIKLKIPGSVETAILGMLSIDQKHILAYQQASVISNTYAARAF